MSTASAATARDLTDIEGDLHNAIAFTRVLDTMMLFTEHNPPDDRDFRAALVILDHLARSLDRLNGDLLAFARLSRPVRTVGGAA